MGSFWARTSLKVPGCSLVLNALLTKKLPMFLSMYSACIVRLNRPLRPVQTHYTRTIQHSTLYDRHCIALLGKVFKRTIHGLYNHSTSMTKQRIVS